MPNVRGLRWIRNIDQITSISRVFQTGAAVTNLFTTGHLWNTEQKASRHQCNMSAELRKSTGSDIKRLQEMVKRLEVQNAQLKSTDNRRTPNNGIDNMVKVKLNLDDVPLLDLNAMVEEDEDTWLVNRKVFWSRPSVKMFSGAILYFLCPSNSTS